MQKKLIALAVAGLTSAAAFAQSNVTVYGVADATYDFMSVSGGATPANNISLNRVSTNSSLIGFKGSESLGNGLSAVFQYESGVSFDSQGAFGATRDSFVGLGGGFGTIVMGNITGPTRAFGAAVDVNDGATGIGSNSALIGKLGNALTGALDTSVASGITSTVTLAGATAQVLTSPLSAAPAACGRSATCASAFDTRFRNTIAYISPTFGGFTVIAGYVPNEGKAATVNPSAYDLGLKYANGPVLVGLSYAKVSLKNAADVTAKETRLVGSYDFGMATVRAFWESTKADTNAGLNNKQNVWGLGATFNATANGKILAQYYRANDVTGTGLVSGSDTGANLAELGYEHSLSKRTMIKAVYARLDNKKAAAYDFGVNATGLASNDATVSGLQIGLRHKF